MRIGIVEIMPVGHLTLVDSIARIYLSAPENEVFIFVKKHAEKNFTGLKAEMQNRLTVIVKEDNISVNKFIFLIDSFPLDLLYITTLEKNFSNIYYFKFKQPLRIVIHNIDFWFDIKLKKQFYMFRFDISWKNCIYRFKTYLIYPFWRNRLVKKILSNNGKFVVLNNNIRAELARYINNDSIVVIPFSVYKTDIIDSSHNNKKIRICIPGSVDNTRRDYNSVLTIFEEEIATFKNLYELDLLGILKLTPDGILIKNRIDKLINRGMKVYYYSDYIPLDVYDNYLSKSNLIMGNLNVILNKFSSYGRTKESGIVYAMIRSAKPGIVPSQYPIMDEMKSSALTYNSYDELKSILMKIAEKREILEELDEKAKLNSLSFLPSNLLKTIN